jgi:undecaprenyl diphosphate synthase
MDGNGRWARRRGLPRIEGHRRGVQSVREVVEDAARHGLQQLTLYCLSSENWKRPPLELDLLLALLHRFVIAERAQIMRQNLRFTTIGRTDRLPARVQAEVRATVDLSRANTGMTLCLALDYGSRAEIVEAVRRIVREVQAGEAAIDEIDEALVSNRLFTAGTPDPDLVIRTAGEMRVSNFLLWQISYAELWVTDACWPDFGAASFREALRAFAGRERRFGGLAAAAEPDNGQRP